MTLATILKDMAYEAKRAGDLIAARAAARVRAQRGQTRTIQAHADTRHTMEGTADLSASVDNAMRRAMVNRDLEGKGRVEQGDLPVIARAWKQGKLSRHSWEALCGESQIAIEIEAMAEPIGVRGYPIANDEKPYQRGETATDRREYRPRARTVIAQRGMGWGTDLMDTFLERAGFVAERLYSQHEADQMLKDYFRQDTERRIAGQERLRQLGMIRR
jgi:hypothetical protein